VGTMTDAPDVAHYYPAPFWQSSDSGWAKSLLLFFDQLSILLPSYMYGRHEAADPSLVIPLEERGLLKVLEPNDWIDQSTSEALTEMMVELLVNGAFDDLADDVQFHELSYSRLGYGVDIGLAEMLIEELAVRGLIKPSQDGVSVPLHPVVRMTILVLLGQLSRVVGARNGLCVHPVTGDDRAIFDLVKVLSRESLPSAHRVIALDTEPVSLDLDSVPLDDVLDFRTEHGAAHKAYMKNLQRFMSELAGIEDPADREFLLINRRDEIADIARDVQRSTRRHFGKNLPSISFGLAGAAWSVSRSGFDPLGAALALASAASQLIPDFPNSVSVYSYIFDLRRQFGVRRI